MKLMVTGATGTIGAYLVEHLESKGHEVLKWNRNKVPVDDYHLMEAFISSFHPDVLIHLAAVTSFDNSERENAWKVNYEWPSELAWICRMQHIRFVFTSSALAFSPSANGPYDTGSIPSAGQGYGYEKRMAEERVMKQDPDAVILRLGWQIAEQGQNSMIHVFDRQQKQMNRVEASSSFYPSCSFVDDTIKVISESVNFKPGIYQVNSNRDKSLYELAHLIKEKYHRQWHIVESTEPAWDQRMFDDRILIPTL